MTGIRINPMIIDLVVMSDCVFSFDCILGLNPFLIWFWVYLKYYIKLRIIRVNGISIKSDEGKMQKGIFVNQVGKS